MVLLICCSDRSSEWTSFSSFSNRASLDSRRAETCGGSSAGASGFGRCFSIGAGSGPFDARAAGLTGLSSTVYRCNVFLLPDSFEQFLALPHETFDSSDELASAGWSVD